MPSPTHSPIGAPRAVPDAAGEPLIVAVPKGRILDELRPLMHRAGLEPEASFDDGRHRGLRFATNRPGVEIIRVRSFDVATFVAFGAAHLGVAGNDVLMEVDSPQVYAPLDLAIGRCRMVVAGPAVPPTPDDPQRWSHIRVATKYPRITRRHFAARGVQAECIKLNGAMELAPSLDLCRRIVDLVSSGSTLRANGLREVEHIADVSARLIVNRSAWKTRAVEIEDWLDRFRRAVAGETVGDRPAGDPPGGPPSQAVAGRP